MLHEQSPHKGGHGRAGGAARLPNRLASPRICRKLHVGVVCERVELLIAPRPARALAHSHIAVRLQAVSSGQQRFEHLQPADRSALLATLQDK